MKNKAITLMLIMVMMLLALQSICLAGETTEDGEFTYTIDDNEVKIEKYIGSSTDVAIPSEIEGYSVTGIGDNAFSGCTELISVSIPDGVTEIGYACFSDCSNLISIEIPESVTEIWHEAFRNCSSLSNIEIPDSVKTLYWRLFVNCSSLTNITIPDTVETIEGEAFYGCTSLKNVYFEGDVQLLDYGTAKGFFGDDRTGSGPASENLTLYVKEGTSVLEYAQEHNLNYVIYDGTVQVTGDADGDGVISSFDAYKALEISLFNTDVMEEVLSILDIDGDGKITSFDAYQILAYSVGIRDEQYWK